MIIESLDLKNYRNYEELHILFNKHTNLLYGDNAQGKTNILEAVYLCATSKSHRGSKDREIIKFQDEEAHIKVKIKKKEIPYTIDFHIKRNKPKGIAINSVPVKKASEIFGILNVVCFSPEDLNVIKEGPSARRKFLDLEICQLDSVYVNSLINYNKILIQRNQLLKEVFFRKDYDELLDIYDEQIKNFGEEVSKARKEFIDEMNDLIEEIHFNITEKEKLRLIYEKNEFNSERKEEIKQKMTLSGPHRDDIAFLIDGVDARKYGSQGQQRTVALSLKLAEIEMVKRKTGDYPVLLLDDVLSELDSGRQNKLLGAIDNIQTIITCTGVDEFVSNNFQIEKKLFVKNGTVTEAEE